MQIIFNNQQELDEYVKDKTLKIHTEWCTNFDLIIEACIRNNDLLTLAQYYTQNPEVLKDIVTSHLSDLKNECDLNSLENQTYEG